MESCSLSQVQALPVTPRPPARPPVKATMEPGIVMEIQPALESDSEHHQEPAARPITALAARTGRLDSIC